MSAPKESKREATARWRLCCMPWPANAIRNLITKAHDDVAWGVVADALIENGQPYLGEVVIATIRNGLTMTPLRFNRILHACRKIGDKAVESIIGPEVRRERERVPVELEDGTIAMLPFSEDSLRVAGSRFRGRMDSFRPTVIFLDEPHRVAEPPYVPAIDDSHLFNLIRFYAYGRGHEDQGDGAFNVDRVPDPLVAEFNRRNFPFPISRLANRGEAYRTVGSDDTPES